MIGGIILLVIFLGICGYMIYSTVVEIKKLKEEERRTKIVIDWKDRKSFEIKQYGLGFRVYVNGRRIHKVVRIEITTREIIITHN